MPQPEFTAAAFSRFLAQQKLMASRCQRCGKLHVPPHPLCLSCHSTNMEWQELSGQGHLAAFTAIAVGTTPMIQEGYDRNHPYCSGVVELKEGVKVCARIVGVDASQPEKIRIGTPLAARFIEVGSAEGKKTVLAFTAES